MNKLAGLVRFVMSSRMARQTLNDGFEKLIAKLRAEQESKKIERDSQ